MVKCLTACQGGTDTSLGENGLESVVSESSNPVDTTMYIGNSCVFRTSYFTVLRSSDGRDSRLG